MKCDSLRWSWRPTPGIHLAPNNNAQVCGRGKKAFEVWPDGASGHPCWGSEGSRLLVGLCPIHKIQLRNFPALRCSDRRIPPTPTFRRKPFKCNNLRRRERRRRAWVNLGQMMRVSCKPAQEDFRLVREREMDEEVWGEAFNSGCRIAKVVCPWPTVWAPFLHHSFKEAFWCE